MSEGDSPLTVKVQNQEIDTIHAELAELVNQLAIIHDDDFYRLYSKLISHTESHFAHEERLMCDRGFKHTAEHLAEHRQMLQEMKQFGQRRLPLSRAYVSQRLPERFHLHITRMDSLLAAFLDS